ncbi:MAG: ABC transporter permease [Anaerolineales bacterium]|nr:ABC transporter permease [Anaerolineales bacterium]MCB0017148.1 ABC transporter permease [Anaerolineales bacterium]MCB0027845.1 ABC transporter permease [Anaerolineales bacterium]MCB8962386.1 ABC transporter permease [Ardenticatenales bacterium]
MTTTAEVTIKHEERTAHRSLWGDVWRQFRKHKGALVGMFIFVFLILFSVVGPFVWTIDDQYVDILVANQGPSTAHPLGTDNLGRDMLAQMMVGGRISISVGLTAMSISLTVGVLIGIIAGYFPALDNPLMRLTDMFFALPILPLLLVIITLFRDFLQTTLGTELGIFLLIVSVIGATSWMRTARVVRGEVLAVKQQEFVLAATSIGTRPRKIIARHIFPNVLSPVMVAAALGIAAAILTESALSFLGLGFPPDFPTWGRLLFDGKDFIIVTPMRVVWPGLAISLTVLSVNFIGDGLRDALDPRLRGRK